MARVLSAPLLTDAQGIRLRPGLSVRLAPPEGFGQSPNAEALAKLR